MAISPDQKITDISEDVFRLSSIGDEEAQVVAAQRWMTVCAEMGWDDCTAGLDALVGPVVDAQMADLLNLPNKENGNGERKERTLFSRLLQLLHAPKY